MVVVFLFLMYLNYTTIYLDSNDIILGNFMDLINDNNFTGIMEIIDQTYLDMLCKDPELANTIFSIRSPLENGDIVTMCTSFRDH